jgi:Fe-S-cluster containining protein
MAPPGLVGVLTVADPDICQRCAQGGPTCCCLEPGAEQGCFPLAPAERDRILGVLSGAAGAFAREANSPAFVENMKALFPGEEELVAELFPEGGFHLRLAVDAAGRCRLLGPQGCVLPREARPHYCRLFPLWPVGRTVMAFAAERCLAWREGRSLRRMLALLQTTEKNVKELHGRLRLAWGLPPERGLPAPPAPPRKKT